MERKIIYLDDAIDALKGMAVPLYKDPACEDIWERDRTLDNAIDAIRGLPSAQPEYEPVKAEDFAKTMSENTVYQYMVWYGVFLTLMKEQGFVICKKM